MMPTENNMKFSSQVKPISYLKNHAADIVNQLADSQEPMLKILALGHQQNEKGAFRNADDVFAELDKD